MERIEHTCLSCDMEYKLKSPMSISENITSRYCPYCGTENIDDLDFDEEGLNMPSDDNDYDSDEPE